MLSSLSDLSNEKSGFHLRNRSVKNVYVNNPCPPFLC
uniref:Uncharacterized protein n=1 Tax=Siphoviridae sp. ct3UN6 TaxID=2827769 RepID=A0A8S5S4C8_9CAUD|nr:MAG TPA: hypothetical protein [Siphoviridae sp. ct3UN6]